MKQKRQNNQWKKQRGRNRGRRLSSIAAALMTAIMLVGMTPPPLAVSDAQAVESEALERALSGETNPENTMTDTGLSSARENAADGSENASTGTERDTESGAASAGEESDTESGDVSAGEESDTESGDAQAGEESDTESGDAKTGKESDTESESMQEETGTLDASPETEDVASGLQNAEETMSVLSGTESEFSEEEDVTEYSEESAREITEELDDEAEEIVLYASESLTPSGTRITDSGTGYTIVSEGDRLYSSAFFPLRVHSNSRVTAWNSAGSSVKTGDVYSEGSKWAEYLLPNSTSAAGKYGYRVTNIAYNTAEKCYVDLYLTVSNFDNYTYNEDGEKVSGVYPYLGVSIASGRYVSFIFNPRLPMMEVKCDLVKSGTMTPVTGSYRMRMLDVDVWQRFGIGLQNGSITGRYALGGSQVYVGSRTAYGHSYQTFNGNGVSAEDDPLQSVAYEVKDTSGFYLLFQIAYRNSRTLYTTNTIRRVYEEALTGTIDANAILNWDGEAYGATEIATPQKYVSNDGTSLSTSNTLASSTSSYYYIVDHFVPEESSSYYYTAYKIYDDLPAGVNYDGSWKAVQLESGADVTGWFTGGSSGKHMEFNATSGALSGAGFYGCHYRFTFRVKMTPGELTPVYSANTASYTVKNTGYVTVSRSSGAAGTRNTNTVSTSAAETRIAPGTPIKGLDGNQELTEKECGSDYGNEDIVFSVFQRIPAEPVAWTPVQITMTDVLQDVLEHVESQVYLQKAGEEKFVPDTAWTLRTDGQTLEEKRAYDASLAGGLIRWDITCRVREGANLDRYHQVVDGLTRAVIPNTARTKLDWTHGNPAGVEQTTNTAIVLLPVSEVNLRVVKTSKDTEEKIPDAVFSLFEWDGTGYSKVRGEMRYQETQGEYRIDNLDRTSENEGKFKIVETVTPYGYTGTWEQEIVVPEAVSAEPLEVRYEAENPLAKGTITVAKRSRRKDEPLAGAEYEIRAGQDVVSPQGKVLVKKGELVERMVTEEDGLAVSKSLYPGEYLVIETKAPLGYDLDENTQTAAVVYQDKDTPLTNVGLTFVNDRLYGVITLTKEIDAGDIVWTHGNPVFSFRIEGTDVLGVSHTYCDSVEFTPENVAEKSGRITLTVTFRVLAGVYTASEDPVMRYALAGIRDVRGGETAADGCSVAFDLSEGGDAAATFCNVRTTDEDESHTAIVRNHIVD